MLNDISHSTLCLAATQIGQERPSFGEKKILRNKNKFLMLIIYKILVINFCDQTQIIQQISRFAHRTKSRNIFCFLFISLMSNEREIIINDDVIRKINVEF